MASNNNSSTGRFFLLTSATLLLSGAAYYLLNTKDKDTIQSSADATLLNPIKLKEILMDLKVELTPYYVHYYNILKMEEEESARKLGSKQ